MRIDPDLKLQRKPRPRLALAAGEGVRQAPGGDGEAEGDQDQRLPDARRQRRAEDADLEDRGEADEEP
jgi:hypothetical protein